MDKKMMTIDLNSKVLLDKAERDGVETMYDRKQILRLNVVLVFRGIAVEYVEWGLVE